MKKIALTFDDGMGDILSLLRVLKKHKVIGTFFLLGKIIEDKPEDILKLAQEGNLIANHSYNHPNFTKLNTDQIRWQVNTTRQIIKDTIKVDTYPYFRYPYGLSSDLSKEILEEDGWKSCLWTNNTEDYKFRRNSIRSRKHIFNQAVKNPLDQTVILMHTYRQSTQRILPNIINWYKTNKYIFVDVSELDL